MVSGWSERGWRRPEGGWPAWASEAVYDPAMFPGARGGLPEGPGGNCQTFAYAVLGAFGIVTPPLRSSELWDHAGFGHPSLDDLRQLDLVLFSAGGAYGAHVTVWMAPDELLHLSREVGRPAVWSFAEFARRERYRELVGAVRVAG